MVPPSVPPSRGGTLSNMKLNVASTFSIQLLSLSPLRNTTSPHPTQRRLPKTHIAEEVSFCRLLWRPQTREYIDWRWLPLSCVHSVMMVFAAQLADGGVHTLPLSSYLPPPLEWFRLLHPLPSKTSKILLHVHKSIAPLPSLWWRPLRSSNRLRSCDS